jgi:hypothetical protein
MPLNPINLDDRSFQDLVDMATESVRQNAPEWTDLSAGDPGIVLLELFSHLTEVMIYRLNRLPLKVYVECLRLMLGVQRRPPAAAVAKLRFTLKQPLDRSIEIPRGVRVSAVHGDADGEVPVFMTAKALTVAAGETTAEVHAYHAVPVDAELIGKGTGGGGQKYHVARAPIIMSTGDGVDLIVAVEADAEELKGSLPTREHGGKAYVIWNAVENFSVGGTGLREFIVDRYDGSILFAPQMNGPSKGDFDTAPVATLSDVPGKGREIRVWYRTGGGLAGNVASDSLTKLMDPLPQVALKVTNPKASVGGREAEAVEHAYERGPQELHSLKRAVTVDDFRLLALKSSGGVNRAFAYNKYEHWRYATRGTVEVICIPHVPESRYENGPLTPELLEMHKSGEVLAQVGAELESRRPLGTHSVARWGRCKKVKVKARVVVFREEDRNAVRERVTQRLYAMINPLNRGPDAAGWRFGQPLSTYDVYRVLSSEPGVKYVDPVRLCLDEVPSRDVTALNVDSFQPHAWYAASGDAVFRSSNDGDGWEQIARIEGGKVRQLMAYPREAAGAISRAGLIAAITEFDHGKSRVHLSRDCGESWQEIGARPEFPIDGMAWKDNSDGEPALLLATEKGLYELAIEPGAEPVAILVDEKKMDLGFWGVAVSTDMWGQTCVAVAARERRGVYLSADGGKPGTFRQIGLVDEKVRELSVQHDGPNRYLWAGMEAVGDDPGTGCTRWQLPDSPQGWTPFADGWNAGGCLALAFQDGEVLAGTRRHGVLRLRPDAEKPAWSKPDVQCGLPMKSLQRMEPVDHVAASTGTVPLIMTASPAGIHRQKGNAKFEACSQEAFTDRVTLPATWLFCSQEHDIEVVEDVAVTD